jgi:hypothetical protein
MAGYYKAKKFTTQSTKTRPITPSLQDFATTPETSSRHGQPISFKIARN